MISRNYVICATCQTHHTLRVQLGYGDEQRHRFLCHHCNEPISFNLLKDKIETLGGHLTKSESGADGKTTYQYLSPDFIADSNKARDPMYFGAMDLMRQLVDRPKVRTALSKLPSGQPSQVAWFALSNASPDWEQLQVCWRLERSGRHFLSIEKLQAFDHEAGTSPWLAAVRLGHRLFGANESLLTASRSALKKNEKEASRLVTEYIYTWAAEFAESEFQIFSEFFKRWDAFSQVYIYINTGVGMPRVPTATSIDFEHVRGFYSLAQEFFANQLRILTTLNNIIAGREFDQLGQISLLKYMRTDNAKRRENFRENPIFSAGTAEYDSALRNAEVHNWLRANSESQTLQYMQGGTGQVVNLRYVDYLHKSVVLFQQICHLMQLEALLRKMALLSARQLLQPPSTAEQ
jgi:hypothetical protein